MAESLHNSPLELIGDGESFKDELCTMLERTQLFQDFSHAEIQVIAAYFRAYEVVKGATIFKEGEKGGYMCIVVDGKIDVYKNSDEYEPKKITTIRSGRSMGEMSMLDELPHSATTKAAVTSTLVLITRLNFERLTEDQPLLGVKILRKFARLMSLRLRQTTGILLDYLD